MATFYVKLNRGIDPEVFTGVITRLGGKTEEIYSAFPGRHPDYLSLTATDPTSQTKLEAFLEKAYSTGRSTGGSIQHLSPELWGFFITAGAPRYGVSRTRDFSPA